jgi:hypothetical protein
MGLIRVCLIGVMGVALTLHSGCSFLFVKGPPEQHAQMAIFDCSDSNAWPAIDLIWAGLNGLGAASAAGDDANPQQDQIVAVGLAWLAVSGFSAIYGFSKVGQCERAKRTRDERYLGGGVAAPTPAPRPAPMQPSAAGTPPRASAAAPVPSSGSAPASASPAPTPAAPAAPAPAAPAAPAPAAPAPAAPAAPAPAAPAPPASPASGGAPAVPVPAPSRATPATPSSSHGATSQLPPTVPVRMQAMAPARRSLAMRLATAADTGSHVDAR